jgi:DNA-binding beta-propeller fold protein YncE
VVFLTAIVLLLTWGCGSASALQARGHVFASSFGSAGSGEGEFSDPSNVAVDEATGELYVVDGGNERVEAFMPVVGGGYEYVAQFKVHSSGMIAVDNSSSVGDPTRGDVFVVGAEEKGASAEERDMVEVYDPVKGAVVHKLKRFKDKESEEELEEVSGVAVDGSGTLWVYWEEEGVIDAFGKELSKSEGLKLTWQSSLRRTPEIEGKFECSARSVFAVAPRAEAFYAGYERESRSEGCPEEEGEAPDADVVAKLEGTGVPRMALREVDHQNTTGVAVDGANGDVFLDNADSVAAFTPAGSLIERFGSEQLTDASGVAVDSANGEVFVAEPDADRIVVFKAEEEAAAPEVDGVSARNLSPTSSELVAQVDPRGADTEYVFQYGTADCQSSPSSCAQLPAGHIAAGFGDRSVSVVVDGLEPATAYYYRVIATNGHGGVVGDPSPDTLTTLPSPGVLPDGRGWEMVSPVQKHGAAVEVTSRFRGGSIQAAADGGALAWLATGPVVHEPQGNRSFELTQLISRRGSSEWETQSLETPHGEGRGLRSPSPAEYHFLSPDLSSSLLQPTEPFGGQEEPPLAPQAGEKTIYVRADPPAAPGFVPLVTAANDTAHTQFGGALEFLDATSDLNHVVFESTVGLTAAAPTAAGLYEWDRASGALVLVSVLPDGTPAPDLPATPVSLGDSGGLNDRGALSSDGSRVVWSEGDEEALYLRDSERGETIKVNAAQGNAATDPSVGGQTLPEPEGGQQIVHFQAATNDGSDIFFTDTARLSEESSQEPLGEEAPADLYEFEVTSQVGEPLHGRLVDLTSDGLEGSADVQNLILGLGADGGNVYFVANGVLAPGATRGECVREAGGQGQAPLPEATCNLYLSEPNPEHPGGRQTRFIAALSYEDATDWGAGLTSNLPPLQGNLSAMSSTVSSDGRYLAFMSERSLTGYDNHNLTGGESDEEVYVYDAASDRLVCASCNPGSEDEGQFERPEGAFDAEPTGEKAGLLVDRPEVWREHWLAGSIPSPAFNITDAKPSTLYQPRVLLNNGRLFFDSPDDLVPAATNHLEDVYEYEPNGVGSCGFSGGCVGLLSSGDSGQEAAFLDASETGDDVFFLTASQLVARDTDQAYDVYDAHVCSESSPCLSSNATSSESCESADECRGVFTQTGVVAATPASTNTHHPETPAKAAVQSAKSTGKPKPLTRAQKLTNALALCRVEHKHAHKQRVACERKARKTYGAKPVAKKKKHSAAKGGHT